MVSVHAFLHDDNNMALSGYGKNISTSNHPSLNEVYTTVYNCLHVWRIQLYTVVYTCLYKIEYKDVHLYTIEN